MWNRQLIQQIRYINRNTLGQTKMCGRRRGGELTLSFQKTEQPRPGGYPGIPSSRLHQRPPLRQVEVVHVVLSNMRWTTPGPCANKKPAGQKSRDQPSLKETATDCGSLVASNSLVNPRLGHQPTSGMDPEDHINTRLCCDEFLLVLFHYLCCFFPEWLFNILSFCSYISLFFILFYFTYILCFLLLILFYFSFNSNLILYSSLLLLYFAFIFLIFVLNFIFSFSMPCFYLSLLLFLLPSSSQNHLVFH